MNIQKFQKYSHEISPLYPALADKAEAISRAIENSPINVTAISDGDGILVKHIIDSLCCAEAVARYADAARELGLTLADTVRYELPEDSGSRAIFVYRKTSPTPARYPREYRKIVKAPL